MENLTVCGKKTELPQITLHADCAIGRARVDLVVNLSAGFAALIAAH